MNEQLLIIKKYTVEMVQAERILPAYIPQELLKNEPVLFSSQVVKVNRWMRNKECVFILTANQFLLLNKDRLVRRYDINRLRALIKSTISDEVVLVYPSWKDLRIQGLTEEQ